MMLWRRAKQFLVLYGQSFSRVFLYLVEDDKMFGMKMSKRFIELDFLRGLAVIGMIVFHAFFILDFYGVLRSEMFSGWWHGFGQVVRYLFLGLVGVGMVISYERRIRSLASAYSSRRDSLESALQNKLLARPRLSPWLAIRWQWRRAVLVFASGMLVSLVTALFLPDAYVRFGILHLIGFSIFVLSFFMWNRWLVLAVGVLAFWFGYFGGEFGNGVFLGAGLSGGGARAIDYFPVFPWIGVVALGIFLGNFLYPNSESKLRFREAFLANFITKIITFAGRHSLLIYLIHVPILVGIFLLFGILDIGVL